MIIGNGNVALDMARLLLVSPDHLHSASDMAPHAVEALRDSGIREVVLVGRRGPEHAAFTTPELLALVNHPDIDVIVDPAELATLADVDGLATNGRVRMQRARRQRCCDGWPRCADRRAKRLVLRFGLTPQEVVGDDAGCGR